MKSLHALLAAIAFGMSPPQAATAPLTADLVILDATVRTMAQGSPQAEAVAVLGSHIVAVGPTAELRGLVGPRTRVLYANHRLVLPGFNDAHVHFLSGGFQLNKVNLRDASTPAELARRLGEFAQKSPPDRWITGGDWDHERWPGAPLPTKELIDPVTPHVPVLVSRLDGHMALANSRALALAGVTKDTPDPPGGLIVRDSQTGAPTGVLKDAAMGLVSAKTPPPTRTEKLAAARAASAHAASLGVTSVTDMSAAVDVGLYQELSEQGALQTRIYAARPLPTWEPLGAPGVRAAFGAPMLRIGALKGFADGSLGSSTALFFEPFADSPGNRGLLGEEMLPEGAMLKRVLAADRTGLQVMIHAIGDRANHEVLSIFEEVTRANGARDRRFRIEHAQHLRPQDVPRFAHGHVIASMQPYHAADDGRWAEKRLGTARCRTTYAFRSLLDAGVVLAFGSDWNVAPLDPLQGIAAAVTRRTLDGAHPGGWVPEERITVEEATRAYTVAAAYAEFQEQVKGAITAGRLADLVVLDRDIFRVDPGEIASARVLLTIMDGRIVYGDAATFTGRPD